MNIAKLWHMCKSMVRFHTNTDADMNQHTHVHSSTSQSWNSQLYTSYWNLACAAQENEKQTYSVHMKMSKKRKWFFELVKTTHLDF